VVVWSKVNTRHNAVHEECRDIQEGGMG
jgi:hypothetical protein